MSEKTSATVGKPSARERIVSLLPSATDHVVALGCLTQLVGRSHECDEPPEIERLPICSRARIDQTRPSGEIDRAVKSLLSNALSIFEIDLTLLAELQPTMILTQSQCEVCAVSLHDVECALGEWIGEQPRIVSLSPQTLNDVWENLRTVSRELGVAQRGDDLIAACRQRLHRLQTDMNRFIGERGTAKPRIACIEWIEPLMAAGNWVPELVELAGGENICGIAGEHSPWLDWDALHAADPDLLIVIPCGFDVMRTRSEIDILLNDRRWQLLRAVRDRAVYLADGHRYFNRPSIKLVDSAMIVGEIIHDHLSQGEPIAAVTTGGANQSIREGKSHIRWEKLSPV